MLWDSKRGWSSKATRLPLRISQLCLVPGKLVVAGEGLQIPHVQCSLLIRQAGVLPCSW